MCPNSWTSQKLITLISAFSNLIESCWVSISKISHNSFYPLLLVSLFHFKCFFSNTFYAQLEKPTGKVTVKSTAFYYLASFFLRFIYFLQSQIYREEDPPSDVSLPKWAQRLMLCRSEARASSGSPTWVQGPKALGKHWPLSRATSKVLDRKQGCRD